MTVNDEVQWFLPKPDEGVVTRCIRSLSSTILSPRSCLVRCSLLKKDDIDFVIQE